MEGALKDALRWSLLVDKDQVTPKLTQLQRDLDKLYAGMDKASKIPSIAEQVKWDATAASAKRLGKEIAEADKKQQAFTESVQKFDMRWLSVMFMGMQVQRTFGAAFRAIYNTYEKATENTTGLGQATMGLTASWEFLKFSIMNALDSPFFRNTIEFIINATNMLSGWINQWPLLGVTIASVIGIFTAAGWAAATLGGFAIFYISVFGKYGLLATKTAEGIGTAAAGAGSVTGALSTGMSVLRTLAAAGIGIYTFLNIMNRGDKQWTTEALVEDLGLAGIAGYLGAGLYGSLVAISAAIVWKVVYPPIAKKLEQFQTQEAFREEFFPEDAGVMGWFSRTWEPIANWFDRDLVDIFTGTFDTYGTKIKETNEKTIGLVSIFNDSLTPSLQTISNSSYTGAIDTVNISLAGEGGLIPSTETLTIETIPNNISRQREWRNELNETTSALREQASAIRDLQEVRERSYNYNVSSVYGG